MASIDDATGILEGYIAEAELARETGESLRTWQRRRAQRSGPPWTTIGKSVYYRRAAVREWLLSREVQM